MLPRISRAVAGLVTTSVVVTSAVPTRAEQIVAPASIDEATFVRRVRERSPRLRAFEERRRAADAAVGAAAVLPNPTLSYEREALPGLDASEDKVRLAWPLDLAGRRGLARSAARAGADAERATADRDALVLELEARAAYLDAARGRELVAALGDARSSLAAIADALKSRATQGDASSYDAERAQFEIELLDDERADAQRELEVAQLRLGAFVGEPATSYVASDALALPAQPSAGAVAAPKRGDVDAARARAREADRERTAARRTWIPRLELVGGLLATTTMSGDWLGYIVGVGGELPVFDAGGAAAARHRAEAKRWEREAAALASDAVAETEQARRELVLRIAQAEAFAAGPAKRAVDLQRRASVAYREGDRPILELLDVHRAARHARVRALELVYQARRAELALRRASGRNP